MTATGGSPASTTLTGLLAHLGDTLLTAVAGVTDDQPVEAVVIHDPLDELIVPPRSIVLAIGVAGAEQIAQLLVSLAGQQVSALVVRAPAATGIAVDRALANTGTALLELTPGATWIQTASLIRTVIGDGQLRWSDDGLPEAEGGDLFAVANAVSALINAPVTIEDRSSRVLAFSGGQDEADASRVETVLGRQVPATYRAKLEQLGVFRRMYRERGPVFVDHRDMQEQSVSQSRTAIAVRAGAEILGSIWAVVDAPLDAQSSAAFTDAAPVVALQMLRARAGADVERRVRSDLVATVLRGGPEATSAASRLGLAAGTSVVLAASVPDEDDTGPQAELEAGRQQLADALGLHLFAVHPRSASALVGGVAYGVLPCQDTERAAETAKRIALDFVARTGSRLRAAVGIGRISHGLRDLERSRTDADRALRVVSRPGAAARVAGIDEVFAEALLIELGDRAVADGYSGWGTLSALAGYDADHHGELVPTLWAYLEELGDVAAASDRVRVHPNTFRYRLRRIADVGNLDLGDPRVRFTAMLQLRLLGYGTAGSEPFGEADHSGTPDSGEPTKDRQR